MGGRQPIEDKPLKKTFFDENLRKYCINFYEHVDYYDFHDSQELVSDFFTVFELCLFLFCNSTLDGFPSSVQLQ